MFVIILSHFVDSTHSLMVTEPVLSQSYRGELCQDKGSQCKLVVNDAVRGEAYIFLTLYIWPNHSTSQISGFKTNWSTTDTGSILCTFIFLKTQLTHSFKPAWITVGLSGRELSSTPANLARRPAGRQAGCRATAASRERWLQQQSTAGNLDLPPGWEGVRGGSEVSEQLPAVACSSILLPTWPLSTGLMWLSDAPAAT